MSNYTDPVLDLSDEELDAQLDAQAEGDDTATPPAGEEPAAEETPAPSTETAPAPQTETTAETVEASETGEQKPEGWNPDGPGNLKAALAESRAREKAQREQLAQYERQQAQAQAEYQAQLFNAQVQAEVQRLNETNPEQVPAYLAQVQAYQQQQLAQQYQQQTQAQIQASRVEMSEQLARQSMGAEAFDAKMTQLAQLLQDPVLGPTINVQALMASENPALAAIALVDRLTVKPSQPVDIQAEVQRQVAAALGKQQQPIKGPKTVGHLSSATQEPPIEKDPRDMTDEELDAIDA